MFSAKYKYVKLADKAPDKPTDSAVNIRLMHPVDFSEACGMLREYRKFHPLEIVRNIDDEKTARKLLSLAVNGRGVSYVAENNTGLLGLIFGLYVPNLWDARVINLYETAFYIKPEAKFKRVGYKLLQAYIRHCRVLKSEGIIQTFSIGEIPISPDYSRFGMVPCERTWMA